MFNVLGSRDEGEGLHTVVEVSRGALYKQPDRSVYRVWGSGV